MSAETDMLTEPKRSNHNFYVSIATSIAEVRQAQALRYQVFFEEMGAQLNTSIPKYDVDRYDHHCYHLLIKAEESGQVIGCTRILTSEHAEAAGGFYSESEFDLSQILKLKGRFLEVGRTCVHADYRNGMVISLLWSGLARFMVENHFDHFMGCASIPMSDDRHNALFTKLQERYFTPSTLRVIPKVPLRCDDDNSAPPLSLPPLLKAYLRLGAKICGEPCWDPHFKVADVFILVSLNNLQQRYVKHFINRVHTVLPEMAA